MSEGRIQDEIRIALSHPRAVFWRNNIGKAEIRGRWVAYGVGGPGGADLIGCVDGRFVAIEVKTERGKQTPDQVTYQKLVESKGGTYVVLRSADEAGQWLNSQLT